jgi:transcriptional regulator with XRE-family HTH domain
MAAMDDETFGRVVRIVRVRRRLRQRDVADRAGLSRAAIWRVEHGRLDEMAVATIRRACAPLELRVDLELRGRGADLDRLVSARHTAMHETVAQFLAERFPLWEMAHEVSFSLWGERGIIDMLLWHEASGSLLIIELKTEVVDQGELLATMDRRRRLAREIVKDRGWVPRTVSTWVIVARSRASERHLAEHRTVLRSAFPEDDRRVKAWLADPVGSVQALSLWRAPAGVHFAPTRRVRTNGPT